MALNLYRPDDSGFAQEIAAFNTAVTHRPDEAAGVTSTEEAAEAVRLARAQGQQVSIQATGHGAHRPVRSGLLVATRRLDRVDVDASRGIARLGAGARWGTVVAAAAEHGLFPVAGSAPSVGVAGLLLGGGLGPFARSHGFSSDYLTGATVVTGTGEVVDAADEDHRDLLWALRGGKYGLGVVTDLEVRLVALTRFYAGSLFFAEEHIETGLRGWVDWTAETDPRVTTSVAIMNFPPLDMIPEPFRGRRLFTIRFAFPGSAAEGEQLAAPLRALAPVYLDGLGEMPSTDVAKIHNDPTEPGPGWVYGLMLHGVDQDLATVLVASAGPGTDPPYLVVELRQLGEATRRDVAGGSAVGGRDAAFTLGLVGVDPDRFEKVLPEAGDALADAVERWLAPQINVNFLGPSQSVAAAWSAETFARLAGVRDRYDPDQVFTTPF
jgi:hypothetical protein